MGINSKITGFIETNFEDIGVDVHRVPGFTMLVFYRETCGACQIFSPILELFAARNLQLMRFIRYELKIIYDDPEADADEHDEEGLIRRKYRAFGEPFTVLFYDGVEVASLRGATSDPMFTGHVQHALDEAAGMGRCPPLRLNLPHVSAAGVVTS